jgi:hypothetical protein
MAKDGTGAGDHLIAPRSGWSVWRWFQLRAAGFPATGVLALAAAELAKAADDLHQLATAAERQARVAGVEQQYTAEIARAAATLRSLAKEGPFREALVWQNRNAVFAADWLLAHPETTNTRARQKQHTLASYLQRYSVKNDTISFFGPIAFGDIGGGDAVRVAPGGEALATRRVELEHWAIDAAASALGSSIELQPSLAPRLMPTVAIDGTTLRYGFARSTEISPEIARLLAACDGETAASRIARDLVQEGAFETEHAVFELLEELADRKLVSWKLELAALTEPERALDRSLAMLEPGAARDRARAMLARLVAARERVAAAAGDPVRLERALVELDGVFEDVTGRGATRHAGETYAARTLVYEECVRDGALRIGQPIVDRLGPVLALVGRSARWFSYEIATRYRAAIRAAHAELAAARSAPVRFLELWRAIQHLLPEHPRAPTAIVVDVADELARRWATILELEPETLLDSTRRRVDLASAALSARVERTFDAPCPGWPTARHVAPDVLIAAPGGDLAGELSLVLGEVHIATPFLMRYLMPFIPEAEAVLRAYEHDVADARVVPVVPNDRVTRADNISWSPRDFELELGATRSWRSRERVLRVADLVVEPAGETLVVRDLRGGHAFDIIVVLESYLAAQAANHFRPAPRGSYVPRITIDGVVTSREQWRFERSQLPALAAGSRSVHVFATVRAWAREVGLPRWVFVKAPEEPKPMYVDFASPIYIEILARSIRKAESLTITEMLPALDETWLTDATGRTFTCELRMLSVDPIPWTPPGERG